MGAFQPRWRRSALGKQMILCYMEIYSLNSASALSAGCSTTSTSSSPSSSPSMSRDVAGNFEVSSSSSSSDSRIFLGLQGSTHGELSAGSSTSSTDGWRFSFGAGLLLVFFLCERVGLLRFVAFYVASSSSSSLDSRIFLGFRGKTRCRVLSTSSTSSMDGWRFDFEPDFWLV
jgi:hypothetical protein